MDWLTAIVGKTTFLTLALAFWLLVSLLFLLSAQRRSKTFTLLDLVTGDNGRASMSKFGQCGAFVVSSWGFVFLVEAGSLSEWYYGTYMVAWTGTSLLNKMIDQRAGKSVTTVEQSTTVTETKPTQEAVK